MPVFARPALRFWHPASLIATWGGCGLVRGAPGTWGSLAAVVVTAIVHAVGGPWLVVGLLAVVIAAGLWASARYAEAAGEADPDTVVVDEVAGQMLALAPLPLHPLWYFLAFVVFRALDIAKPWPIDRLERRLPGGRGIMADDLAAGAIVAVLGVTVEYWVT